MMTKASTQLFLGCLLLGLSFMVGKAENWVLANGDRLTGELVAEIGLAIEMGADARDIGLTVHPHPTLSETVAFSAEAFEGTLTDLYVPKKA